MSGNGSKGGVHHGTRGNPQIKFDNNSVRDANQIAKELQKYGDKFKWPNDLTRSMRTRINTGDNIIKDHCKAKDLSGIKAEINGKTILNKKGVAYKHIEEARYSIRGLENTINSLEKSLKNPNLSTEVRIFLKNKIRQYQYVLDKLNEALEGK